MKITVTNHTKYHHMSDYSDFPDLYSMTLRQGLKTLREVNFGGIGGTYEIELSDDTTMDVVLVSTGCGARLMSSQYVWRHYWDGVSDRTVRNYTL